MIKTMPILKKKVKKTIRNPEIKELNNYIYYSKDYKNIKECKYFGPDYDLMAQQYAPHCK